jgi:hypothetical protein
MAAFNSMIDRMLKFPMNITNQREELKIIDSIARFNGYDDKLVNRIYQRQKSKAELRALTTLVPSVQNETFLALRINYKVFSNAITSTSFIPIGVNYLTYLETRRINVTHWRKRVSTKLHVKVVKQNASVRQKNVHKIQQSRSVQCCQSCFGPHSCNEHTISIDSLSILREVRKPSQLDAYESIFIQKGRKNQQILLNEDEGNIRSILFNLVN